MLNRKTAEGIITDVTNVVKDWRKLAVQLGISKREMELFAGVLDKRCDIERPMRWFLTTKHSILWAFSPAEE